MLLLLTACGTDDKNGTTMDSNRTLTQAVTDYEAFNDTLIARIEAEFGTKPWEADADSGDRSYCGANDEGMKAILPRRRFDGTYPAEKRDALRDLVIKVGKEHGFGDPELVVEKPDYLKVVAEDGAGGRYTFAMSVNTILSTWTGCHAAG
jgi:hypothetical protein